MVISLHLDLTAKQGADIDEVVRAAPFIGVVAVDSRGDPTTGFVVSNEIRSVIERKKQKKQKTMVS